MENNFEINGESLREDYKERLLTGVKRYYLILKFFSIWLLTGLCLSSITIVRSYIFDESFNEGLFQFFPFKLFAMTLSLLFICGLIFGAYKMLAIPIKTQKAVEKGNFVWRTGQLSNKERVVRRSSTTSTFVYVDGEKCIPLGLSYEEFETAVLGDEFIVIRLIKPSVVFALKL